MRNSYVDQANIYNKIKLLTSSTISKILQGCHKNSEFITDVWRKNSDTIAETFSSGVPVNFLQIPEVSGTMFVNDWGPDWLGKQYQFLDQELSEMRRDYLLKNEFIGGDLYAEVVNGIFTNHNNIHSMYHLLRYEKASGKNIQDSSCIIEWGGGYGNLARLLRLYTGPKTYVLVDTTSMLTIQWLFLSCVFGEDCVNILTPENSEIKPECFNLVHFQNTDLVKDFKFDMFISTWALDECTELAQDYVANNLSFFGAKKLLLALQVPNYPDSQSVILDVSLENDYALEKILYFPENEINDSTHFYIFQ